MLCRTPYGTLYGQSFGNKHIPFPPFNKSSASRSSNLTHSSSSFFMVFPFVPSAPLFSLGVAGRVGAGVLYVSVNSLGSLTSKMYLSTVPCIFLSSMFHLS